MKAVKLYGVVISTSTWRVLRAREVMLILHEHMSTLLFWKEFVVSKPLFLLFSFYFFVFFSNLSCIFGLCTSDLSNGYSTVDLIFKRKNMEYIPERHNPHLFWIVDCLFLFMLLPLAHLSSLGAETKFKIIVPCVSFFYQTDCWQNRKKNDWKCLNFTADICKYGISKSV